MEPIKLFKKRVYDLLANREKLAPVASIGILTPADSSLCTALGLAGEALQIDSGQELAEAAFDGLAAILLQIYNEGLPAGPGMVNPGIQRVAEILHEAGEAKRAESTAKDQADTEERA